MNNTIARASSAARRGRRGSLSILSVFALVACGVCVALVVNSAYLTTIRSEAQQCAEAAALAGCRSLLCDEMLCANRQAFEADGRILECQRRAIDIAARYGAGSRIPSLTEHDIRVAQRVFADGSAQPTLFDATTAPNLVEVTLSNESPSDPSGRLVLSGLTGVRRGQILARAAAVLENRIAGFIARSNNAIPLAPFSVPDDSRFTQSGCWSVEIEAGEGPDNWTWSQSNQQVLRGGDRLPEITLTLTSGDSAAAPGQLLPVSVLRQSATILQLSDQLQTGLTSLQMQAIPNAMLEFPVDATVAALSASDLQTLASQLEGFVGQVRIFPTSDIAENVTIAGADDAASAAVASEVPAVQGGVVLTRPIAARIMDVRRADGGVQVTLQPAVISTATAVTAAPSAQVAENAYIWKIALAK